MGRLPAGGLTTSPPPAAPAMTASDPNEDSALELSNVAPPGEGGDVDLGSLLDASDDADLTVVTMDAEAPGAAGGARDLDAEIDTGLDGLADADELPVFATTNSAPNASAEATRVAFDAEMPDDGDGQDPDDEIEDLFVELIEE